MNLKTIMGNIEELAAENMTEDGIHHDDWTDHEGEYIHAILDDIISTYED